MNHRSDSGEAPLRAAAVEAAAEERGIVLLSASTGEWFLLDEPTRAVWERLEYPATPAEVSAALGAEFDAPAEVIAADVAAVLADLEAHGLVVEHRGPPPQPLRDRYLRLLKRTVANLLYPELELQVAFLASGRDGLRGIALQRHLRDIGERDADALRDLEARKLEGRLWGSFSHTMIGLMRLNNIERCAERVFADRIEGDFLEAGVCRGGAAILMRALQVAHGEAHRKTWLVDSFQGVPPSTAEADRRYDTELEEAKQPWLACDEKTVREHFARYDLLDGHVEFVAGWLEETLPGAPIGPLAILRIDVDLYSATANCLDLLYDRVVPGGFVIVDDYGYLECCRDAVDDFRARRGIAEPIERIDYSGIFWRKARGPDR